MHGENLVFGSVVDHTSDIIAVRSVIKQCLGYQSRQVLRDAILVHGLIIS